MLRPYDCGDLQSITVKKLLLGLLARRRQSWRAQWEQKASPGRSWRAQRDWWGY